MLLIAEVVSVVFYVLLVILLNLSHLKIHFACAFIMVILSDYLKCVTYLLHFWANHDILVEFLLRACIRLI